MSVRPVLRMGHPILRQKARALQKSEIKSPAFKKLIKDMIETMHKEEGIGIAAPQLGESLRVSVIEFNEDSERYPNMGANGLVVFVNPVIKVLDSKPQGFWEGCLSVPGLRGFVERPRKVEVTYLDEKGEEHTMIAEDFLATVVQHEFDHLDGVLYVDRIQDTKQLAYIDEYQEHILQGEEDQET